MTVQTKFYTVAEFERFAARPENQDRLFELIRGEIIEKMPTQIHGAIVAWIVTFINLYLLDNPIGIVSVETRHQAEGDDQNALIPDISFVKGDQPLVREGDVLRMPDLAVEIKSKTNTYTGLREKALYYLQHGSQMVWLVYPEKQMVEVYHRDADIQILTVEDSIDGGELLPGFSLPVEKIFRVSQK